MAVETVSPEQRMTSQEAIQHEDETPTVSSPQSSVWNFPLRPDQLKLLEDLMDWEKRSRDMVYLIT